MSRLEHLLENRPEGLTVEEIAKFMEYDMDTARRAVKQLVDLRKVKIVGNRAYLDLTK